MKNKWEKIRENKERNREQSPKPATLEHSVTPYDPQGSYSEPIIFNIPPPNPQGGNLNKNIYAKIVTKR